MFPRACASRVLRGRRAGVVGWWLIVPWASRPFNGRHAGERLRRLVALFCPTVGRTTHPAARLWIWVVRPSGKPVFDGRHARRGVHLRDFGRDGACRSPLWLVVLGCVVRSKVDTPAGSSLRAYSPTGERTTRAMGRSPRPRRVRVVCSRDDTPENLAMAGLRFVGGSRECRASNGRHKPALDMPAGPGSESRPRLGMTSESGVPSFPWSVS